MNKRHVFARLGIRRGSVWLALACLAPTAGLAQLLVDGNQIVYQDELGGILEAGDGFGETLAAGDFDNDGFMDLAIGAPTDDVGVAADAGAVFVTYGSAAGLGGGARLPLLLHQDVTGVHDTAEAGDNFGASLAVGNFNGDSYDDLAVGVRYEGFEILPSFFKLYAGAVHIFYGGSSGLGGTQQFLTGDSFVPSWGIETGDELGAALAAGDSRGCDGVDDLLIGVPFGPHAPGLNTEGVVIETAGTMTGIDPGSHGVYVPPGREDGDRFGSSLAVGDLDNGGCPDPIMGAPFADIGIAPTDAGAVWIRFASGFWTLEGAVAGDNFASALAVGDFKGGGYPQLLVTLPGRDSGAPESGLTSVYDYVSSVVTGVWQGLGDYLETPEPLDRFAETLAVGDFNNDGYDDAAFGVPGEDLSTPIGGILLDAGIVQVAYGSSGGLASVGNQVWGLETVVFGALPDDRYGGALAAGDFNGDGADDLGVGVPGALFDGQAGTGFVHVLYGWSGRIFADGFESGNTSAWSNTIGLAP